jgi:hypothetical protein
MDYVPVVSRGIDKLITIFLPIFKYLNGFRVER